MKIKNIKNVDLNKLSETLELYNNTGDNKYIALMYQPLLDLAYNTIKKMYPTSLNKDIKIQDATTRLIERIIKHYNNSKPYRVSYWLTVIRHEILYQELKDNPKVNDYITEVVSLDELLEQNYES